MVRNIAVVMNSDGFCFSESTVQLTLALVFGTVGIFMLVLLIVLSQQHR